MFATWSLGYDSIDASLLTEIRRYLVRREAANCIQLSSLASDAGTAPGTSIIVARDHRGIQGVATHTGTFLMLVSHLEVDRAAPVLVESLLSHGALVPGVMGPEDTALAFAERWRQLTGGAFAPGMRQRILQASAVTPPGNVPGGARPMTPGDHPMLHEWFAAFASEAEHTSPEQAQRSGESMLARLGFEGGGLLWLDEAGVPVSIACYKGATLHGIRIGPVYTPTEHRRHGYAAAVTAEATRMLLAQGFDAAFLYTDAANQTANHVYESIGYEFAAESMQYRFDWAASDDELDD